MIGLETGETKRNDADYLFQIRYCLYEFDRLERYRVVTFLDFFCTLQSL